jgi:CRP-like cAMP-binding protein
MSLDQLLQQLAPLPTDSLNQLKEHITEQHFSKGHILLKADRIEPVIYFIKKGIARAYSSTEDADITFWFGKEGDPVLSMKSYVANEKGYENVELLEDSTLYVINTRELRQLFEQDIHIANWGRRLAEKELIRTEERLICRQVRTATERYKDLLNDHPDLIRRVQLGHIASYLGITQVSLSRIRAELR